MGFFFSLFNHTLRHQIARHQACSKILHYSGSGQSRQRNDASPLGQSREDLRGAHHQKDFSLDPEENHMRIAARNMVANMSSGMMLITGKEPLTSHLYNSLKLQFTQPLSPDLANAYKDLINQTCGVIVQDNIELCMCFLQKIAIKKSILKLERKLQAEFESRLRSRTEGRIHCDQSVLSYHNEKLPDMIKLRVGSVSPHQ